VLMSFSFGLLSQRARSRPYRAIWMRWTQLVALMGVLGLGGTSCNNTNNQAEDACHAFLDAFSQGLERCGYSDSERQCELNLAESSLGGCSNVFDVVDFRRFHNQCIPAFQTWSCNTLPAECREQLLYDLDHVPSGTGQETLCSASRTYVNSPQGRTGDQVKYYTDFSFSYPSSWIVVDQSPDSPNYVELQRIINGEVVEWSAVGSLGSYGSADLAENLPALIDDVSESFRTQAPNYREISRGEAQLGSYAAYELLVEHTGATSLYAERTFWQRILAVPLPGTQTGVTLLMGATNASPDVKHAQELGVAGGGQMITLTFKLGS